MENEPNPSTGKPDLNLCPQIHIKKKYGLESLEGLEGLEIRCLDLNRSTFSFKKMNRIYELEAMNMIDETLLSLLGLH